MFYNLSMKKDFSQDFQFTELYADIIVRDVLTKKYLLLRSTVEHEEDFFSTLSLAFKTHSTHQVTKQLAEYLYSNGLVLNSYRELAKRVGVSFSFMDDTPGSETTNTCFLAEVDVIDLGKLEEADTEVLLAEDVYELLDKLSVSPYYGIITDLGIARLISEDKALRA